VPKSPLRRKSAYTPPPSKAPVRVGSPRWVAPLMVSMFVIGLVWIVVYYVTQARWPVEAFGNWNLAAGFGFILAGFALSTRWK
jgi:hypothetical protein